MKTDEEADTLFPEAAFRLFLCPCGPLSFPFFSDSLPRFNLHSLISANESITLKYKKLANS